MKTIVMFALSCLAVATAVPLLVQDAEGQQYYLEPVSVPALEDEELHRERRQVKFDVKAPEAGKLEGAGGFNSHRGGGGVQYTHPNGATAAVGYGHANGYGHDLSVDYSHPVWSNGKTSVNLGGGFSGHTGGPFGTHGTDRRVTGSITHRW